ncbi:MAG: tetratricopeptide repeat protein [Sphingomonas sp.]|uniref:tetratricopeptide repeat protein n=1 Tax=Sphingomonas sp. TaxID=28214 RepID=UPI0017F11E69|nr:tetratricopeptide repeat protein [Sphingomonas sp.]MBA3668311.1 tetratricopeptide repeat protein [Sphingomonas sp.]
MRLPISLSFLAAAAFALTPAAAQRRPPTPEQRIDRLEKQVRQVQKQVFPKGQPADTAGFSDDPAATQDAVSTLGGRLDAVERQMSDLVRQSEENGNRLGVMEADLARLRADQDRRLRAIEQGAAPDATGKAEPSGQTTDEPVQAAEQPTDSPPPASRPKIETPRAKPPVDESDPNAAAEAAYDAGFQLWTAKKYDAAIASLKAMAAKYPDHRRVSWANNLIGRSMLDKGQPRAAAEALLANYRRDPKGERAQDSLFYLGKSLVKLGQPSQACKAYGELEEVYGATLRAPLKVDLPAAKAEAKCK